MKTHPFAFVLMACISPASSGEGWLNNIEKAQEQAKKESKLVLVEFTQTNGDIPCKKLKANVFDSPEFKTIVEKSLVPVALDFAKKEKTDPNQEKYKWEMFRKFDIMNYPTVYLLEAENGTPVWIRRGEENDKDTYLKALQEGINTAPVILEYLKKAKTAEGMEKAKLLDKAYKAMSLDLREANSATLVNDILDLDEEDTLGYAKDLQQMGVAKEKKEAEEQALQLFVTENVNPLLRKKKHEEAIVKLKEYAARPDVSKNMKQRIYAERITLICQINSNIDGVINALEEGIAIDPTTDNAKEDKILVARIKDRKDEYEAAYKKYDEKASLMNEADAEGIYFFVKENVTPLLQKRQYEEGVVKLKEYAAQPEISRNVKQAIYLQWISPIYMKSGNFDGVIKIKKEGIALAPNSDRAQWEAPILDFIEKNKEKCEAKYQELLTEGKGNTMEIILVQTGKEKSAMIHVVRKTKEKDISK